MKAVIQNRYGGPEVFELVDHEKPSPKDNQVLIEIHATNIASGDKNVNTLELSLPLKIIMKIIFGWSRPRNKIRGMTAAGEVVEIGKDVKQYSVGDKVYFINSMKAGCLAEYIALNENAVMAPVPENISYIDAAPLSFGAMSAYHFINSNNINENDKVLIYGASGSVGSYAVQLAKYYGASVTAVCSKKNHEAMISLGADHVIDYHTDDFRNMNKKYDVIFDAVMKITKSSSKKVLTENGKYLSIKMPTKEKRERLLIINDIVKEGKMKTLIDKVYPFNQFKEAHEHVYTGHKVGNVVIEIKK
ncbi:NAD(P)-dependent alcohol dehydrogenase [Candidatus Izimaplasma bacterium]|nr:NAD(P)-dependent alcohol dehydrogenase [Candidatus Izimaplasma bacterium]